MSGGREMLTPTSTPAIAGTGNKNSNANSIVLKSIFFISFPRHRRYGIFFHAAAGHAALATSLKPS
jgi:hypothetical protein